VSLSRAVLTAALALATVVSAAPQKKAAADKAGSSSQTSTGKKGKSAPATAVDLNTASDKELEAVPGIGRATAKKIIDHRPYQSVDDLAKAGIARNEIDRVRSMVTVSGGATARTAAPAPQPQNRAQTGSSSRSGPGSATSSPPPAGSGMVWVNTETKVYHREGDRWFGKTKHGSYMTEADAIKAGNRAAK